IVHNLGFEVSGSDLKTSPVTGELKKQGCRIYIGHRRENIKNADVIVTSSAISPANEELLHAREKGITVIHRSEMLAELMRLKFGIAVAGTHGKTTTTSIVASVCIEGGLKPTSVIGGNFLKINSNSTLGKGNLLICEADESDGSFLNLSPTISIITNIDNDHMDFYKTEENLRLHFLNFMNRTPFYGKNIICFEDQTLRVLAEESSRPYVSYGFSPACDLWADKITFTEGKMNFQVHAEKPLGEFSIQVPGRHNVLNALAAIAAGLELAIPPAKIKKGIASFNGVARRMYTLGYVSGFRIMDDYGHHPTEIRATFEAVRLITRHLAAVFQPHRFTRTMNLYREFADALSSADTVFLTDIYPAGETPIKGISSALIYELLKKKGVKTEYIRSRTALKNKLKIYCQQKEKGILLFLGAGDIYKTGRELVHDPA
ncbi:MAG TPA: UDP-N-acetylmuramate--L-alanine ligase, partial [Spirochaetia bacterium]|nr:UDP-N-acetylmuramate--L-alanine ligase [Spirochaetia bacterium]